MNKSIKIDEIEQWAENLLKEKGVYSTPTPIEELARKLQAEIRKAPSKNFSGLLLRKENVTLIGVNSNESALRQRYSVGHEIGHLVLHPRKDAFVDYRDNKDGGVINRSTEEKQANMFAAALLMPRKKLQKDISKYLREGISDEDVSKLASKYQVSKEAMQFRLRNLGLS